MELNTHTEFAQDGFDINVQDGELLVTFAITAEDVKFGVGSAAFLLSVVDNVILTGPHELFETDVRESNKNPGRVWQGEKPLGGGSMIRNCKIIITKTLIRYIQDLYHIYTVDYASLAQTSKAWMMSFSKSI